MTKRFDAVALDIDGTIMDTTESSINILYRTLRAAGVDVSLDEMDFARHATDVEVWEHYGVAHRQPELQAIMDEVQIPFLHEQKFFPGILSVMQRLREMGVLLALVSNRTDTQIVDDPIASQLLDGMEFWVSCETLGVGKPDPAPLFHFLEKANCAPERALFVGDSPADALASQAAGIPFALALWGAFEKDIPADYRLDQPEDILTLFAPPDAQ